MKQQDATQSGRPTILDGWSLEATLPKPGEMATLAALLAPGTEIYLSTLPHVSVDRQIETAAMVRASGFEPVLHVAVRYFSARRELAGYLARANRDVGADRLLVVAGDIDVPRGAFGSSLDVIESGLLQDYGIRRIGVAGYPDGHPKIGGDVLRRALDDKLHAAMAGGLDVQVVTQFCFDGPAIIAWLAEFRARWPGVAVKVGLAGPASAVTLLKFAIRCGVAASIDGLNQNLAAASRLVRSNSPGPLIEELDAFCARRGDGAKLSAHFFSFGGLEKTARWVMAARDPSRRPAKPGERAGRAAEPRA